MGGKHQQTQLITYTEQKHQSSTAKEEGRITLIGNEDKSQNKTAVKQQTEKPRGP